MCIKCSSYAMILKSIKFFLLRFVHWKKIFFFSSLIFSHCSQLLLFFPPVFLKNCVRLTVFCCCRMWLQCWTKIKANKKIVKRILLLSKKKPRKKKQQKRWKKSIKNIIKCKAKLYETYELLSKRILHKLYAAHKHTQNRMQKKIVWHQ